MMLEWERKRTTAHEAVGIVKSGQQVGMAWAPGDPPTLQQALLDRRLELENVRVGPLNGHPELISKFCAEESVGHFNVWVCYVFPYHRAGLTAGRVEMTPPMYGLYPRLHHPYRQDPNASDVFMIRLSPPDSNGYCSFGTAIWHNKDSLLHASHVIAEIDETYIRTYGDNHVHISEIDQWIPTEYTGVNAELGMATAEATATAEVIGYYASTLIRDGDTIQIGAGSASAAIYEHLRTKNDLGLHTEVAEDMAIDLVEAGIVTNRAKTIDRGKTVAAWIRGTEKSNAIISMNPAYEVREISYVDNPNVCARLDNFVAVNSALMVDVTGQIGAESIGYDMHGGPGGQPELMLGALLSNGGRNIICLPSTAAGGSISRIVTGLPEGTGVTTPRHFVDYVVSEHGIAELFGRSLRQRAAALISISHPDYQDQLREAASRIYGPIPAV
jgi:4-hydroxybutyrate CoA-transferase